MDEKIDNLYFSSYEDLKVHHLMVFDGPRTLAYKNAIDENSHLFADSVVLDVGTGTGILALFAARAGARKVYAVEASDQYALAARNVARNNLSDVIEVIHCRVEDLQLAESVDIIVSEWMGFYLLHESMLDSVIVARDRFLKPNGHMFPAEASLYACPCTAEAFYQNTIACWNSLHGLNLSSVGDAMRHSMLPTPQCAQVHTEELLTEPQLLCHLQLSSVTQEQTRCVQRRAFCTVARDGAYRALALWFTCHFPGTACPLTTAPQAPPTHWKQMLVMLPTDYAVERDEVMGFDLQLTRCTDNTRHYEICLQMLDEDEEHPVPCGCAMAKCRLLKVLSAKDQLSLANV